MVDLTYAYANARVKAMKSKLLDEEKIRSLLAVNTLDGVVGLLEETPYREAFVAESTRHAGIELFAKALEKDLATALKKIWRISPKKMRPILQIVLKQWDVNNLKIIISSKALGKPVSFTDLTVIEPSGARLFQKLLACGSVEDVARALAKTEYGPAVNKALNEYNKTRDYRILAAALDSYLQSVLAQAVSSRDRNVKEFVGKKINALNALTILRLKQAGASPETIRNFVAPVGKKPAGLAKKLLACETVQEGVELACAALGMDKTIGERFRTRGSLAELELEIEKMLVERARKTMARSVLSPGAVLGYLHLKDYEVQSLRKIAFATLFEMKEDVRGTIVAAG